MCGQIGEKFGIVFHHFHIILELSIKTNFNENQTTFADLPNIPESTRQQFKTGPIKCSVLGCPNTIDPTESNFGYNPHTNKPICLDHFKSCENCGKAVYENDIYIHNSDLYCEKCYNELFAMCPNCEEIVDVDDLLLPHARSNQRYMKEGGCTKCCKKCENCDKIVDNTDVKEFDSNFYCEDCFNDHFFYCEKCGNVDYKDESYYVEDVGELCKTCFSKNYVHCENCSKIIENEYAIQHDGQYYCSECADEQFGISPYSEYTENFDKFTYTKKDKFLRVLLKLLPISSPELKAKNPSVADGLKDLISMSKGQTITLDMVKKYREFLNPEELPVEYTTWDDCQRSINQLSISNQPTQNAQLVMNILASPTMLNKLKSKPNLYDLFDKVNTLSEKSGHPYIQDQLGWARLELDPNKEFILVDEIQCDHSNACYQIKSLQSYNQIEELKKTIQDRLSLDPNDEKELDKAICRKELQEIEPIKT